MTDTLLPEYLEASNVEYTGIMPENGDLKPLLDKQGNAVVSDISGDGFQAQAFLDPNNNVIVAFKGSLPNPSAPIGSYGQGSFDADAELALGQIPAALTDAKTFMKAVVDAANFNHIAAQNIFVTGHSLGGAEAEYVMGSFPTLGGGDTFGAPGINVTGLDTAADLTDYVAYGDPIGNFGSDTIAIGADPLFGPSGVQHVGQVQYTGDVSNGDVLISEEIKLPDQLLFFDLPDAVGTAHAILVDQTNQYHLLNTSYAPDLDYSLDSNGDAVANASIGPTAPAGVGVDQVNLLLNQNPGVNLLLNLDNTIHGSGYITVNIINEAQGVIEAQSGETLNLLANVTNSGTVGAVNGGVLDVQSTVIGGDVVASAGGSVDLFVGHDFVAATLKGDGTGSFSGAGYSYNTYSGDELQDVTIQSGVTFTAQYNNTTALGGTIANSGVLAAGNGGTFAIDGPVTLDGGGQMQIGGSGDMEGAATFLSSNSNNNNFFLHQAPGADQLTNVDNTIHGNGYITVNIINEAQGVIAAESGETLSVNTTILNAGTVEAVNGGAFALRGAVTNNGLIVINGASATVYTALTGTGNVQIENGGYLKVEGTVSSGQQIYLDPSTIEITDPADFHGTLHLSTGDEVIVDGVSGETYAHGAFIFTDSNGDIVGTINAPGYSAGDFSVQSTGGEGIEITLSLCYLRGTRILTPTGEVLVESLKRGDRVVTRFGGLQQIKWIGRQSYRAAGVRDNREHIPVRLHAGSLGEGLPARDLYVSPGHSMLIEGTLVLAKQLVNGITITQSECPERIDYFQIELEAHDCVIAEGTWSETYADWEEGRALFHNAAEFHALYPDHHAPESPMLCAPRPERGVALDAALRPIVLGAGLGLSPGALRGFIDCVRGEWKFEGWAHDESHPELPVLLEILLEGQVIGTALACDYREDLLKAGYGQGRCSFTFISPIKLRPALLSTLQVRRSVDGAPVQVSRSILDAALEPSIVKPRLAIVV